MTCCDITTMFICCVVCNMPAGGCKGGGVVVLSEVVSRIVGVCIFCNNSQSNIIRR